MKEMLRQLIINFWSATPSSTIRSFLESFRFLISCLRKLRAPGPHSPTNIRWLSFFSYSPEIHWNSLGFRKFVGVSSASSSGATLTDNFQHFRQDNNFDVAWHPQTSSEMERSTSLSSHSLSSISHNCTDRLLTESRWLLRTPPLPLLLCCCCCLPATSPAAPWRRGCSKLCRSAPANENTHPAKGGRYSGVINHLKSIHSINICNFMRGSN